MVVIDMFNKDKSPAEIKERIDYLNKATLEYEKGKPFLTDKEWDDLYFELVDWEKEHGLFFENAPDVSIYFETVSKLEKVEHNHPMLSLQKTKDLEEIKAFCGDKDCIAMLKMDGLTCSLYYEDGKLVRAETRGNGYIGEDITHNALVIPSIPKFIDYHYPLVVDGEVICKYDDFEPFAAQYKNPRNFAAGSIRLLEAKESYNRHLTFVAWDAPIAHSVLYAKNKQGIKLMFWDEGEINTLSKKLQCLNELGFEVVPWSIVDLFDIEFLKTFAKENKYPIDGLVYKYNNCDYYNSLGATSHHFRGGIAYKFYDEEYETRLVDIDWTMGRTGTLTPVAVFEPIDTGDSIVTRANMHNISIMYDLYGHDWHTGMHLKIYLANMIIPQVKSAEVAELAGVRRLVPPPKCPICGGATEIRQINDSQELICTNPDCQGKLINRLDHFCSKKGLDIKGLSKATLEKLIDWEWVTKITDIYGLKLFANDWAQKPGFGEKSVNNILDAIEASKTTTLDKFLAGIGIPLIGNSVAKDIVARVYDYCEFRDMVIDHYPFWQWNGFGEAKCEALWNFDYTEADEVYHYLNIITPTSIKENYDLNGKTFVITGKLNTYKNRDELKELIEARGGKVASAISRRTSYLINNDIESTSSKNKKAIELDIPIISEESFNEMI